MHNPKIQYLEVPGEAHDAVVMDRGFGIKDELASEQFLHKWLLTRLKWSADRLSGMLLQAGDFAGGNVRV